MEVLELRRKRIEIDDHARARLKGNAYVNVGFRESLIAAWRNCSSQAIPLVSLSRKWF